MDKPSKIIDLTHALSSDIPRWDDSCGFELKLVTDYKDCAPPDLFRTQKIAADLSLGTHMDAPAHCIPGAKTIDALRLEDLVADCAVIKIDGAGEDHVAMPDAVERFERENGAIQPNTFVIFCTGWDKHWDDPKKYRNGLKFPSVHESTAKLLLERGITGLGIDALSADARGESFPVHRAILGAGKYLVENVANADQLPATGAKIFVMPVKIKEGTEAPIRLVAII